MPDGYNGKSTAWNCPQGGTWNRATAATITLSVVQEATATVTQRLDQNFFRVRFDRLTPSEKRFLRGMAGLGPGAHRSSEIAAALGAKINHLSPVRAKLIHKGMIYSPSHGAMKFTAPLFDEFMLRAVPELAELDQDPNK